MAIKYIWIQHPHQRLLLQPYQNQRLYFPMIDQFHTNLPLTIHTGMKIVLKSIFHSFPSRFDVIFHFLGPTIDKMLISLVKVKFSKIWVWMWSVTPSMVIMFVFLPTDRLVVVKLTPWWAKRITRYYLVMICQIVTVVNRFYNNQRLHTTVVWKFPKSAMKYFETVINFGKNFVKLISRKIQVTGKIL